MVRIALTLAVGGILATLIAGCASVTKTIHTNADGTSTFKEQGNILLVANWNYDRTLSEEGDVIKRDDCNELFPLFKVHVVEDAESIKTNGYALLLFEFGDAKPKTAKKDAPATQPICQ